MIFFFNDTATTEIYTLSLHDALPIYPTSRRRHTRLLGDRKSTRLNSSHPTISYAVFCLERKRDRKSTRLNSSHPTTSHPTTSSRLRVPHETTARLSDSPLFSTRMPFPPALIFF